MSPDANIRCALTVMLEPDNLKPFDYKISNSCLIGLINEKKSLGDFGPGTIHTCNMYLFSVRIVFGRFKTTK